MTQSKTLVKAVLATAQLMGSEWDADAARMFCADLASFSEPLVLAALAKCRREVRGRLTVADVVARIDDGRPGPDEAWSLMPRGNAETVVWSAEMRLAWAASRQTEGPSARAAFVERYKAAVADARQAGLDPAWQVSEGWDAAGREGPIRDAVAKGRLGASTLATLIESAPAAPRLGRETGLRRLSGPLPKLAASLDPPKPLARDAGAESSVAKA